MEVLGSEVVQDSRSRHLGLKAAGVFLSAVATVGVTHSSAEASVDRSDNMVTLINPNLAESPEDAVNPDNELVIYTFNVLGSNHANGGRPKARARAGADVLLGRTAAPRADIVGVQEMEPDQERYYERFMGKNYRLLSARNDPHNAIMVNTKKLKVLNWGTYLYSYYYDRGLTNGMPATWVHAKVRATGKEITVDNSHFPAGTSAKKRQHDAYIEKNLARRQDDRWPKSTEFVIGDKNSNYNIRLKSTRLGPVPNKDLYCVGKDVACLPWEVLTANNKFLLSSFDMAQGLNDHEENNLERIHDEVVDWIFLEPGSDGIKNTVKSWQLIKNARAEFSSDHYPLAATVQLGQSAN